MIKILFLAANPSDTLPLKLDEESRSIDFAIRKAEFRDKFRVEQHWAVRVSDLQEFLLRHKPDIVHFSGHGSTSSQIILNKDDGTAHIVPEESLKELFTIFKDTIKCVLLNSCYSKLQAEAISKEIDCVIGVSSAITDEAALQFSTSFYQALGYGCSIQSAYELGCQQINMETSGQLYKPELLTKTLDSAKITFVDSRVRATATNVAKWGLIVSLAVFLLIGIYSATWWYSNIMVQYARNLLNTGIVLAEQKEFDKAIESYKKAIEVEPTFDEAYYHLAEAYSYLGNVSEAIIAYENAIRFDEDNALYHLSLGTYLIDYPEEYSSALEHLERSVALDESNATAYNELGYLFIQLDRWSEARVAFEKGLGFSPLMAQLNSNMGKVELHDGRVDAAIDRFKIAIKNDRRIFGGRPLLYLAEAYTKKGQNVQACEVLGDFNDLFPPSLKATQIEQELQCNNDKSN